ncbi:CpcT/CpeT family chromophore lyase [Paucibacter sp. JuS9]|uniref:CpcT/CpeT family chromophore lyase n=1 Tax=Paucibacter sp. JuS9 TaxID=3228748 RepID=UPI003756C266
MKLHRIAFLGAAGLLLSACAATSKPADPNAELASHLSGYFTSAAQAAADKDYFNIELRIVPVWTDRTDGPWLYVEQADARTPDKPYRQRVYRLETQGGKYLSHIYEFKGDPLKNAGQWKQAAPLAGLNPADIVLKDGCAVIMERRADGSYVGATADKACPSVLRGARYGSSKVTLDAKLLESWDQGFDAEGKQIWGATKGAYKFVKISAKP